MNIYKLTQSTCIGHDTYDSAVVVAESEADAVRINPSNGSDGWPAVNEDAVTAVYIGIAAKNMKRGVIIASFNAG